MYKKLLLLATLPLVANERARIPVGWNKIKGVALGASVMVVGGYIADKLNLRDYVSVITPCLWGAGGLTGYLYIRAHDPEYRFSQLLQQNGCIYSRQLTHTLQECPNVNNAGALLYSLNNHYVIDQNPYYQAYVDMINMRQRISEFLHEARILHDHFYHAPEGAGRIALLITQMEACDALYARALVTLKSTPEYRESVRLQQAIEQTEHLAHMEQLALANAMRPQYVYINGR